MNIKMNVQMPAVSTWMFWLRRATRIATTTSLALTCLMLPLKAADDIAEGQLDEGGGKCSNATLKGNYGLLASGIRGVGPGVSEMYVLTGLRTYDGKGGFTTISNAHGQVTGVARDLKATGTYQVNADCTGTTTIVITGIPEPLVSTFVIVDSGKEVKEASMEPSTALATAVLTKM